MVIISQRALRGSLSFCYGVNMKSAIPPTKHAGLMNTDRVRTPIIDNRWDDDGFWRFGYGNDPRRRRYIRRVEKQDLRNAVWAD